MTAPVVELVRHEIEVALRTRRILLVAALYLSAAVLGGIGISLAFAKAEQMAVAGLADQMGTSEEAVRAELSEYRDEAMTGMLERFEVDVDALAPSFTTSIVAPVFFWCSLAFLPLLVILATFDTIASDLRARTLCYTTLRAPRWAIVVSKGFAWWAIVATVAALSTFVVFAGAAGLIESLSLPAAMRAATRITLGLLPFEAAWVAIALWCSALTNRPMTALVWGFLTMVGLRMLTIPDALVGRVLPEGTPAALLGHLRWLSPSTYHDGLWHGLDASLVGSSGAYLVFAAVFGAGAIAALRRRDL